VAARKTRYDQISQQLREQRRQSAAESRETMVGTGTATRGRTTTTRNTRSRSSTMTGAPGQDPYGTTTRQPRSPRRATTQEPAEPALSADTQAQLQAWLNGASENKDDLLKTTHELDVIEYAALHGSAEEEKAAKTRVAVMALLMLREERIAKITVKWQEEDERLKRMQERMGTDPTMQGTQQGTQQGTRFGGRR
jgi:hypothetical protein